MAAILLLNHDKCCECRKLQEQELWKYHSKENNSPRIYHNKSVSFYIEFLPVVEMTVPGHDQHWTDH